MNIGKKIKKRRHELELTQLELALKCGYKDKTSISKIENGDAEVSVSKLSVIANALECDPLYLMSGSLTSRTLGSNAAVQDIQILSKFACLNDDNKDIALGILDVLISSQDSK